MDASELVQFVQQVRLDVEGIGDPVVRNVVHQVFNLVEEVVHHDQRLRDENVRLAAENASLRELLQKAGVKPPPVEAARHERDRSVRGPDPGHGLGGG